MEGWRRSKQVQAREGCACNISRAAAVEPYPMRSEKASVLLSSNPNDPHAGGGSGGHSGVQQEH